MPCATTPHIPSTSCGASLSNMWHVDVPRIITSLPGVVTEHAGTATCASMLPTATGVPAHKPVHSAIAGVNPPALLPSGQSCVLSFSATTCSSLGCSALKNFRLGYVHSTSALSALPSSLFP